MIFTLVQIFKAYVYSPVDPLNWSGPIIRAASPRPPICITSSFSLPPSAISGLVFLCRQEKTTITALVTVLVARKRAIMYPSHTRFTGTVAFSLRKFTKHSQSDMGCYVSDVKPYFSSEANPPCGYISCRSSSCNETRPANANANANDKQLWENARICKKFIEETTSSTHNQMVNMLKFVTDYPKYFMGLLGTKRPHAFEVSNIGVLDGGVGRRTARKLMGRPPLYLIRLCSQLGNALTVIHMEFVSQRQKMDT